MVKKSEWWASCGSSPSTPSIASTPPGLGRPAPPRPRVGLQVLGEELGLHVVQVGRADDDVARDLGGRAVGLDDTHAGDPGLRPEVVRMAVAVVLVRIRTP